MSYIPLTECIHGKLYRIRSRNLTLGVFNSETNGFIGIREKFDDRYLFTEYHWDLGASFCGTVKPKELLEECPIENLHRENDELFDWLDHKMRERIS